MPTDTIEATHLTSLNRNIDASIVNMVTKNNNAVLTGKNHEIVESAERNPDKFCVICAVITTLASGKIPSIKLAIVYAKVINPLNIIICALPL
jgi:hypothetical protein